MSASLIRLVGGPSEGTFTASVWPQPDELEDVGGVYRKVSQSSLTDEQAESMTHVMRGAEYEWVPLDG